jgi:EAL domain-containing protein (putative c-di-GMP-specific phosphodiesterase class I)
VLQKLKAMGVRLAIDDFGTGYSILSYLRQFPIDTLKVDQSFIHEINAETDEATIISAVINTLSRRLLQSRDASGDNPY